MDKRIADLLGTKDELPLDRFVTNGGFTGIFRTIACVGDSLSSGELESLKDGQKGYHDYFDYSWGQYLARDAGCKVYNFSRGGMTASEYCNNFAETQGMWNPELAAQGYIIALGVNDMTRVTAGELAFGEISDVDLENEENNKPTFIGYYAKIIQRYKKIQPYAKFFLMTVPKNEDDAKHELYDQHAEALYQLAELFDRTYVLDFRKYAPVYDKEFHELFFFGHMSPCGYRLTALMVESYIDYLIRHNMQDFKQVGFIGTPYFYEGIPR